MDEDPKFIPYEETHRLHQLMLLCVVANEGQEEAIASLLYENEAYACFFTRGKGTSTTYFAEVVGTGELRKVIVFSIIRADVWGLIKRALEKRFAVSRISKGIAFTVPLSSIMSVSVYKMLGNIRFFESPINKPQKKKFQFFGGKKK